MALIPEIQILIGELVEALTLTSRDRDPRRFSVYRESAFRTLKGHTLLRTNQFEVASRLAGLEERFRITSRETLADLLRSRRDAFAETALAASQHGPETLHLCLELADQPTQKSRLDDVLELVNEHSRGKDAKEPALRWEDIAHEDGWDDEGDLWQQANFEASSDDGTVATAATGRGPAGDDSKSDISSMDDGDANPAQIVGKLVVSTWDDGKLRQVQESQAWRTMPTPVDSASGRVHKIALSEFQILREALLMLHGVRTTLFDRECVPVSLYQMEGVSWESYRALANTYAEAGRGLRALRLFARKAQTSPHLQVFHDCIVRGLGRLDREITGIETRLVAPQEDFVVSMIAAYDELKPHMAPLLILSEVVRQLQETASAGSFLYLERLFDEVAVAQLTGRTRTYEFLARVFFESFNAYVRPVRLWVEEGKLVPGDKIFFVAEAATKATPDHIWDSQFRLRRSPGGALHAPSFLPTSLEKIFTAGKSIVILRSLGRFEDARALWDQQEEPRLDFRSVCGAEIEGWDLIPFPDLFIQAFDRWIHSKHYATSSTLKGLIFNSCGLETALDSLEYVYFMRDGAATNTFVCEIFKKLDAADPTWNNHYSLTTLAQDAYSAHVDPQKLSITVGVKGQKMTARHARDSVRNGLPEITPRYRLSWPVQMVLANKSTPRYQAVFTLLLQLGRAATVLTRDRLLLIYETSGNKGGEKAAYFLLRSRILWFCATLQTYLSTLVLAPNCAKLREDMRGAVDVDAIIAVHGQFAKRVADEACLGSRLEPIRESMLDILDLAIRLQAAWTRTAARVAEEAQELSRLSNMSSPLRQTPKKHVAPARGRDESSDDEDVSGVARQIWGKKALEARLDQSDANRPFGEVVRDVKDEIGRHLGFITNGLRGVARATSDPAAAKWDLLAEMLEMGHGN